MNLEPIKKMLDDEIEAGVFSQMIEDILFVYIDYRIEHSEDGLQRAAQEHINYMRMLRDRLREVQEINAKAA